MKSLLTILLSLFTGGVFAQLPHPAMQWIRGYGGSGVDQVLQDVFSTPEGDFIIHIESNSRIGSGNIDSLCYGETPGELFVKYNSNATTIEWCKSYGIAGDSFLIYIFPTNVTDNVFGGIFNSTIGWGFFITKHNSLDRVIWQKDFGKGNGALLRAMIRTDDGGYILGAQSFYTDSNVSVHYGSWMNADIWILKIDSSGNKIWSTVIGGSQEESVSSLIAAPGGGCYVTGSTQSNDYDCTGYHGGGQDAYIARIDSLGNLLWHRDLGGSGADGDFGWAVSNGKGGVLFANGSSSTDGDVHHHIGDYDFWLVDIDSNGNMLWENSYGSQRTEFPSSVCRATDNSIWIAGMSGYSTTKSGQVDTAFGDGDAWVVHVDSIGTFLSAKVLGSSQSDWAQMIHPLSNGGVITGGLYGSSDGNMNLMNFGDYDAFLAVFDRWTTNVPDNVEPNQLTVFPNPAREVLNIHKDFNGDVHVLITNVLGEKVYAAPQSSSEKAIQVSDWQRGVYLVQITDLNGNSNKQLVVLE